MKTAHDCIPCLIRQTLNAVRLATSDENIHISVLRKALKAVSIMDLDLCPPLMGQHIHRLIREQTGSPDPYKSVKDMCNRYALALFPELEAMIRVSERPFESAVRLAIAGNIIDFGANIAVDQTVIRDTIAASVSEPLIGDVNALEEAVRSAEKILYLGDNTGEIVFDRLLVARLPAGRVTFVVRGGPIINDAPMEDAAASGMTELVPVIDNGSDAPGTILEQCSTTFKDVFEAADLIIAKGQGNYETLSGSRKRIFFLLKAKCPVIAEHIGCRVGDSVISQCRSWPERLPPPF
jgi:damage-control phosphatase, subfamily I